MKSKPDLHTLAEVSRAKFILANINWNFSTPFSIGRSGARLFDCRKHHWFPATFISEIPYTLIEVLTTPGAVVFDPFAGIGTTVFQSLLLGRKPYATEICRVAVEFMRALWVLFDPRTDLSGFAEDIGRIKDGFEQNKDYAKMLKKAPIQVERLRPWFQENTFNQIMYLAVCEQKCRRVGLKAAMRISFSAVLKSVCAQDEGWGCIADNMLPKPRQLIKKERSALERFIRNLNTLMRDILKIRDDLPPITLKFLSSADPTSRIAHIDVTQCTDVPDESVDLIVTSPPYPNMTDYSTSQRLSYYWLGADPMDDLRAEIGARRRRFGLSSVQAYRDAMEKAIKVLCTKLRPSGYACFVMPIFETKNQNNTMRKQVVQECLSFLLDNGLVLEQDLNRILPRRRRHHNQQWTSLERECIYIYRKVP
jgi:hypothetical protein